MTTPKPPAPPKPPKPAAAAAEGRVASLWRGFERAAVPAGASQAQRDHMKAAFYCGGYATIQEIMNASDHSTTEPTPEDEAIVGAMYAEFETFAAEMKKDAEIAMQRASERYADAMRKAQPHN